ncbi:MAG TPA: aminoacyl-tRNA hydrolase [Verrucomicrobiae bacterium]
MESLYLIVGLGNPGSRYANTRHNAGFLLVEELASKWGANWTDSASLHSRLAMARAGERKVWLCQPQTYMNDSGLAVQAVVSYYRVPLENVVVVVDDADLPIGEIRLRGSGGTGGHHGLESIEKHLGSRQYARLRVGIGRQEQDVRQIAGYVLGQFGAEERELFGKVAKRASDQIDCWLTRGLGVAMSQFNGVVTV